MAIENESNLMVLFLNLSDLLLWNQYLKDLKNQSFATTDEGFLEKLRISYLFYKSNGFGLIHTRGRKVIKKERRTHLFSFIT